jgi:hypothetical protein
MMRRLIAVGAIGAVLAGGGCTSGGDSDPSSPDEAAQPGLPGLCGKIGTEHLRKLVPNLTVFEAEPSVLPKTKGPSPRDNYANCDVAELRPDGARVATDTRTFPELG